MLSTFLIQWRDRVRLAPEALVGLVYALFFVAGVAQAAIVPLLPRLAAHYALSSSETALLLALPGLATLAVSVPSGIAADRFGARRVTLVAAALLCASCLAQSMPSLALMLLGRLVFGISFGVIWTTGVAWLAVLDSSARNRVGPSVTISSAGMMVGPAIGGTLARRGDLGFPFLLIAFATSLVAVALLLSPGDEERRVAPGGSSGGPGGRTNAAAAGSPAVGTLRGLAGLARRPGVLASAGALMVSGAVSGVSQLLISGGLHADGVSTARIGLAFSVAAVCYLLSSATVLRLGRRARNLRFNALATSLLALALVPAAFSDGASVLICVLMLSAVPRAAISTVAYALAGDGGSDDGSAFGLVNGAWAAAMVMMPLLAGALQQHAGARAGYLIVIVPAMTIAVGLVAGSRPRPAAVLAD